MQPLPSTNHPLVLALDEDLRPLAVEALAATPNHYVDRGKDATARNRWATLLERAGFARYTLAHVGQWYARPITLPETWNERQRSAARLFAEVLGMRLSEFPLYESTRMQRQMLELEPRGPLFDLEGGVTFFERFRVLAARPADKARAKEMVFALPIAQRLVVLGELMLAGDCSDYEIASWLPSLWSELRDEGASWAPAYADRLLGLFEDPRGGELAVVANGPALRAAHAVTVLLALVRAKIEIEPRWDRLFTLWNVDATKQELWEIVDALPAERREVAVARIVRGLAPMHLERWAPELLSRYPFAIPTRYVLENLESVKKPRDLLKALKILAKDSEPMAAVLHDFTTTQAKILAFSLGEPAAIRAPVDLDEITAAQLVEANRLYGGMVIGAEDILKNTGAEEPEGEPQIEANRLERRAVLDASGQHVFDLLTYNVDAGTFFEKGTTRVVAEIIQFDVHSKDRSLAMGLSQMLKGEPKRASKAEPKTTASKAKTKKRSSKKND